jgi:hypothetical protein
VFQDRLWVGDPRLGAFAVRVDGTRAGVAPIHGEVVVPVSPGQHTVRIGQWWYRSPNVTVTVPDSSVVRLRADIPTEVPLLRRWMRFMFRPSTALSLTPIDTAVATTTEAASKSGRRVLLRLAWIDLAGFLLLDAGITERVVVLTVLGAAFVLLGVGLAVRFAITTRR